jgi:exopolyphosphatase / guanosine-5'-triphosphate,3'-diphosphate pyrophosphatase
VSRQVARGAVLDLGSSSFQLLVCEKGLHDSLRPVLKRQSLLNLGLEVGATGRISSGKVKESITAAKSLRRALERGRPDVVVPLATAALRDAANSQEVVASLEHALGAPIRVLDGPQEARLCFVGQRAGVYIGEGPTLGIDLGGGSFELAVGNCYDIYAASSAPVGATRLQGELGVRERLDREVRKEVRERAREALEKAGLDLSKYPRVARRAVLSGGTARALARLAVAKTHRYAGATGWGVNQVELSCSQVAELADVLAQLDLRQRLKLPGMPARRAPVLPLGACILQAIAEELRVEHFVVSEWGLREGALLEALSGYAETRWSDEEAG